MVYGKLVHRFLLCCSIINYASFLFLAKNGNLVEDPKGLQLVDELNHLKLYPLTNKNTTEMKIQEKNKSETRQFKTLEKSTTTSKKEPMKNENHSQDVKKTITEKARIFPPENVASYLFETNDIQGVEEEIERLIQSKALSKYDALDYISEIRSFWKRYDEQAVEGLIEAEREKAENGLLSDMLNIGQELNKNAQLEKLLYNYVQRLYGGSFSGKIQIDYIAAKVISDLQAKFTNHIHAMECDNCEQLKKTLKDIKEALTQFQFTNPPVKIGAEYLADENDDRVERILKKFMLKLQNEVQNGRMEQSCVYVFEVS
uniref:Uncharacterized protein n=1 Tax=Romanomermis culicivorax TaxID=13658 RepID=A0A915KAK4_ROMCU